MSDINPTQIHATGEATGFIPAPDNKGKPITVIGTEAIRAGFDATCLQQALNSRSAPGVTDLVLNPDAHAGYGAPVGCVLVSPTHIYPGPVGVDIKCSMSLLQLDLPADQVADKTVRRALINAILERTPTGAGSRPALGEQGSQGWRSARREGGHGRRVAGGVHALGIPPEWAQRCEDAAHVGHDGTQRRACALRLEWLRRASNSPTSTKRSASLARMAAAIISANAKSCECSTTTARVARPKCSACAMAASVSFALRFARLRPCAGQRPVPRAAAQVRGLGHSAAGRRQGTGLCAARHAGGRRLHRRHVAGRELRDREPSADQRAGAGGVSGNHSGREGVARVFHQPQHRAPGIAAGRPRRIHGEGWVHRKGATRAFPAGHPSLKDTPFEDTGHPILLPGNPTAGSVSWWPTRARRRARIQREPRRGPRMGRKAATASWIRRRSMTNSSRTTS